MQREHKAYEDALRGLGARVIHAPDAPDQPDAVFVEDTAIVLDEVAVGVGVIVLHESCGVQLIVSPVSGAIPHGVRHRSVR